MKKKLSQVLSILLTVVMCSGIVTAFAASVGSDLSDTSVGYDAEQGVSTEYSTDKSKTDVYMTVDGSGVIVGVPTSVILNGSVDTNGKNIGKYSVYVQGDIPGDMCVTVKPETEQTVMHQTGKSNKDAVIAQPKMLFDSNEIMDGISAEGTVNADNLSAGSWDSDFNFLISMNRSVSAIADAVVGFGRDTGQSTIYLGNDDDSGRTAKSYDAYVLPVSELGLSAGDSIVLTSQQKNTGFVYAIQFLDENWNVVKNSNYVWQGVNRTILLEDNYKYMSWYIVNEMNVSNTFDKHDIPFDDFRFYKNTVSDENELDYISVYNRMLDYDNSLEFTCEKWGHNMDFDYQQAQAGYNNQSLEKNLKYFDGYDLDLKKTSDGVVVCYYYNTDKPENYTYAELKAKYPDMMTFEEMAAYMKANNKKCFVMPLYSEVLEIAQKYDILDKVYSGNSNPADISSTGNKYVFCQTQNDYNLDVYKANRDAHTKFYMNTDDYLGNGDYFTDEQINELLDNDINLGISFCMEHKVTAFVDFCKTHDFDTLNKVTHFCFDDENAYRCLKAATRYVYGM